MVVKNNPVLDIVLKFLHIIILFLFLFLKNGEKSD